MDKTVYLVNLYDYYSSLLTEKQREYFEDYYFKDLSLSEISENKGISRNGIYKVIKETENKLNYYEKMLCLYDKSVKIKKLIFFLFDGVKEKIEELIQGGKYVWENSLYQ